MLENNNDIALKDHTVNLSVMNGSDVVIGQKFYLDIEIIPKSVFTQSLNIDIKESRGFESIEIINKIDPRPGARSYNMKLLCFVKSDSSITSGDEIFFTLTGINKLIKYSVKDLIKSTIQLKKNKIVCVTPNNNDYIVNEKENYIRYCTTLFDSHGNLLKNTPVHIFSEIKDDIERKIIITTDPDNIEQKPQLIKPQHYGDKIEAIINSDKEGRVKLRVYPIMDTPAVINLYSKVENVAEYPAGTVYMISAIPSNSTELLDPPFIPELSGDLLDGDGRKFFDAMINSYPKVSMTDSVLFFNKKKENGAIDPKGIILPVRKISDIVDTIDQNDSDYTFLMRRDVFPTEKDSVLYYVIAPYSGKNLHSDSRSVKYIGEELTTPDFDVKRTYDMPVIFSSFADIKSDPKLEYSDNEKKRYNEIITQRDISNYPVSGCQLYVKIMCTNDEDDQSYPLWGKVIYLRMYVKSRNKNFNKIFKVVAPYTPDVLSGKTATIIFKIDSPDLNDVRGYINGGIGMIYFEYYIINPFNQEKVYSHYWKSKIQTSYL
ncbi:hypothetical protein BDD26_3404 [Xenorhabdus cabanillasii]|uniref:Uncharacterized protein n=1 Tax=Xenorhabdus cabanillasii TaxID=351673 RepID=A0A3D9UGI4_9GAMM|nr:hypothetical protein [Xenorhabdus cabanillasii]REF28489.1 hypothetical protein BDD26_3404 [Xenorhabdus cabanillasii]